MKLNNLFLAGALSLSVLSGNVFAETDKASKQSEIRKVTQTTLEKFYKSDPEIKAAVAKAPGYAVFTTYGLSFIIGGGGGTGLAHNNKTKKDTFMSMAQASAGGQIGLAEREILIVFNSAKGMNQFVTSGWTFGGSGSVQAGAGGKSTGQAGGGMYDYRYYTLTKNGLDVGIAAEGTKFWKDKDLN